MNHRGSGLYSITNLANGKRYIGQSKNVHGRLLQHKSDLKNGRHHNEHLQNAFTLSGIDLFEFSLLEVCDQNVIDEREKYWIKHFKTVDKRHGYNYEDGGNAKKSVSDSTKAKLSKLKKGVKLSEEHRRKIGESGKGRKLSEENKRKLIAGKKAAPNPLKGVPRTDEVKAKLSAAKKGKPTWNKGGKMSQEWKDKIGAAHKGKVMSEESRLKMSESKKAKATPEMMEDIQAGMMRKDFAAKYGNKRLWTRIKNELKQS